MVLQAGPRSALETQFLFYEAGQVGGAEGEAPHQKGDLPGPTGDWLAGCGPPALAYFPSVG